ncbi:hypothetical protein BT96DRAFT_987475 [Gymnopus androsaceus JB14]|uniref:Uncharacterized protein n=1 Tax=Gymnopus androsaceus JB14 TaxID=1447944 RepID=A0A6A4I7T7_9AGAR|nr:hypothetical protein BT96DRAFT_987475 [Gymnopus androsaceus JB14]
MRKKDWISKDADGEVPDDETIPASSKLGLSVFNSLEALKKKFPNAKDKCIWTADSTGLGTDFVSVETTGKDGHIYLHPTGHHHSTAKELKTFLNEKFTKHAKRQVLRWERSEVGMLEDRDESLCSYLCPGSI